MFLEPSKHDGAAALQRLADLGITVKVVTGGTPAVAVEVRRDLGLDSGGLMMGADVDGVLDARFTAGISPATTCARVSREQKARIVRAPRRIGGGVSTTPARDSHRRRRRGATTSVLAVFGVITHRRDCYQTPRWPMPSVSSRCPEDNVRPATPPIAAHGARFSTATPPQRGHRGTRVAASTVYTYTPYGYMMKTDKRSACRYEKGVCR